ncbi:hypothetical protein [Massilia sp. CCM 8734]|uniref:hypothetical protein n=1 Tax=Massilia sp. CCM 8734 TaxID=2609283 RepID=UPI00141F6931|nr:hypothetical protein [Massilia sp. CCM 8734]NHZ99043.1 hypothetical protein [Massilia sp. CCM 8734]
MNQFDRLPLIEEVLSDPAASNWLKHALMAALQRDAVYAANDSTLLAALLDRRADAVLSCCRQAATDGAVEPVLEESRRVLGANIRIIH